MSRRAARAWSWLAFVALLAAVAAFDRGEGPATAALGHAWAALVGTVPGLDRDEDDVDDDDDAYEEADDDDDDDDAPLVLVGGMPAVHLDDERQGLAGVKTARLEAGSLMPTIPAVGDVVDVQPLAALRDRYREEFFRAEAADVVLAAARREHERLDALYRDNADVARKAVLRAEADWQAARAERYRLWASLDSLRARARGEWGPVLAEWAFADDGRFRALASGGGSLLRAVLPPGRVLPSGAGSASLVRNGSTIAAAYVSPAPRTADGAGESHFFLVSGLFLPAALRLSLRIPLTTEPATGLALPQAAVVRALGRAWAYVRFDDSHFVRRAVSLDRVLPDGRYLVNDLDREDEVATVGAAILYAEEFRSQIRDEDDDD